MERAYTQNNRKCFSKSNYYCMLLWVLVLVSIKTTYMEEWSGSINRQDGKRNFGYTNYLVTV